jgi:putative membrane protein
MLEIVLETFAYLGVGLVMMMLGYFIIDLFIPIDFPQEINDGNKSVGWVSAGIYAALGFVIRSAIISNTIAKETGLLQGVVETVIYAAIGVVAMVLGYFLVDVINRKFNFNEALKAKNEAAGIMVFGIFLGVAFIVSGVIQ